MGSTQAATAAGELSSTTEPSMAEDYAGESSTPGLEDYQFPVDRLKGVLEDSAKTPLVLVACGSFVRSQSE